MEDGNKMKKIITAVFLVTLLLIVGGCSNKTAGTTTPGGKQLFTLRLPSQSSFSELIVADQLGYFKDEGIQIKWVGLLNGTNEVESVVTGSTDVFTNHADTVVKYILGGAKIKIVAPGIVDSPKFHHMDYLSSANGPKSWQDFLTHKYKVGMSGTDTCSDLILYKWLASHNIPQSQVDIVVLPDPQLEEALKLGQVDVACFHPPFNQTALADGFKELFSSYDVVQGPAGGASIRGFSDQFIQQHPDVVAGFTVALVRAHHWINAHQQQAIQMNADYLKVAPQNLGIFWYDDTNWVQDSYMQWWVSSMKEVGQLKPGQDIQASDIYTNAYNPYYTHQDTTTSWDKPSWDQQ
jgi:ABC-type nitrate/sulfonate/bicarbonate transport system substrate-binding protein